MGCLREQGYRVRDVAAYPLDEGESAEDGQRYGEPALPRVVAVGVQAVSVGMGAVSVGTVRFGVRPMRSVCVVVMRGVFALLLRVLIVRAVVAMVVRTGTRSGGIAMRMACAHEQSMPPMSGLGNDVLKIRAPPGCARRCAGVPAAVAG